MAVAPQKMCPGQNFQLPTPLKFGSPHECALEQRFSFYPMSHLCVVLRFLIFHIHHLTSRNKIQSNTECLKFINCLMHHNVATNMDNHFYHYNSLWIIVNVVCGSLSVANGQFEYNELPLSSGGYPVGTVADWTCNYGYYKFNLYTTTCHSSGSWTHQINNLNSPYCARCIKNFKNISLFFHLIYNNCNWKTRFRPFNNILL